MTRKMIRDILVEETKITDKDLDGIEVHDDFSFVNVSHDASDKVLRYYKKISPDKPIVVKAKGMEDESGKRARSRDRKRRRR